MLSNQRQLLGRLTAVLIVLSSLLGCTSASPALPQPAAALTPSAVSAEAAPAPTASSTPIPDTALVVNPGFENRGADGSLEGWNSSGDGLAVLLEEPGHSGSFRLTHKTDQSYLAETSQTITGLADDWYTLSAWVRSSGQNEAYLGLTCAGQEKRVYIPATAPGELWIRLVVSNQVTTGECQIGLHSAASSESWASFDDIELKRGQIKLSLLGADISSLNKSEDLGGVYKYRDGTQADALQILQDNGLNYARLRVWVDPADGYHNKAEILEMALRLKRKGIKLLVDFHYSDDWADPGKQYKPAAWANYSFEQLKQAVYDHTFDVCSSLAAQGTPADLVQVGNEINAGMLWPDGDYNHFDNLAELLKAGYQAVKDSSSSTRVMLHIAEGGDNELARWWFDNITRRDVPFDVIGVSFYPIWHGSLAELQGNLNDLAERYDKDVVVAEFAYGFSDLGDDHLANIASRDMAVDGYLFTPEGQRLMTRDILSVVRGVPNGRGLGLFYWDATWTAVSGNGWDAQDPKSGNGWENQALFDFNDRALPALAEYLNP